MEKPKSSKKLIILLSILLIAAIAFIAVTQARAYNINKNAREQAIYDKGASDGYQYAVSQLVAQLAACKQVPIYEGNTTVTAVAAECLQKAGK
jgi:uncharacterized protein YpmB